MFRIGPLVALWLGLLFVVGIAYHRNDLPSRDDLRVVNNAIAQEQATARTLSGTTAR